MRTAWLYSPFGNNFVKTMLRLMEERTELSVVCDQVGTPTHARGLAELVWALASNPPGRILHWADLGVASWYDFAVAIQEEATALGKLSSNCRVRPIPSDQYPQRAVRPAFSVLDRTDALELSGLPGSHWRTALRATLARI